MVDFEVEQFLAQIRTINERFYGSERALATFTTVLQNSATAARTGRTAQDAFNTVLREGRKTVQENAAAYKSGSKSYADAVQAVRDWRNEAVAAAGANEDYKKQLQKLGSQMESELGLRRVLNNTLDNAAFVGFRKSLAVVGDSALGVVKSYQGGATDIAMANTVMQQTVQAGTKTFSIFGEALQGAGAGLAVFGGSKTRIIGLGLEVLGTGVKALGEKSSQIANQILPILGDELQKYYTSFMNLSSAGAMFADGLTGMVKTSGDLNLTLPEFTEVVRENSVTIAQSGKGLTETLNQMGDVVNKSFGSGQASLSKRLLNLGYSFKDQAALVAETMASMRQSGDTLANTPETNQRIAEQTEKYAENLRLISAITGEDAKKRIQEVRQQSTRLAFQQKMQNLTDTQRQEAEAALAAMSAEQQQAVMETIVIGRTITPALAYMTENIDGFGESTGNFVDMFNQGNLTTKGVLEENARTGERIKSGLLENEAIGRAGFAGIGGIVGDLEKVMGRQLAYFNKVTPESVESSMEQMKRQKEASDAMTDAMNKAAQAGRDFATELQKTILQKGPMELYANLTAESTQAVKGLLESLNKTEPPEKGWLSWLTDQLAKYAPGIGAGIGAGVGAVATSPSGPGAVAGGVAGAGMGYVAGEAVSPVLHKLADWLAKMGFAEGGIVSGSKSGFPATLHGNEVVIPLPESLRSGEFATILQSFVDNYKEKDATESQNTNIISQVAQAGRIFGDDDTEMRRTTREQSELLEAMNNKLQELIEATQSVAKFTRDTSMRIA